MNRPLAVLFWSVIAAAFIGPGTVTTAASAGSEHRYSLLWALVFSTLACLVLQEAAARLTIVSGRNLGQALRRRYPAGAAGALVLVLVVGAILVGCAAYEAGNILGGVEGIRLATGMSRAAGTLLSAAVAALLLWFNRPRQIARILSLFVACMGAAFLCTAALVDPPLAEVARGGLLPTVPRGSLLLILGLVGTTVVPYNLFLGSGIAGGQSLGELRFGLTVAILAGGVISIGVLVTGAAMPPPFSFQGVAAVLAGRLGGWSADLFAAGLFAAGMSSAITAPLAAAVTAASLFGAPDKRAWGDRSARFRAVWIAVLAVGTGFGLSGVRPVPAIILAQALNGVLLPLVSIFLFLAVNDRRLMRAENLNGPISNAAMATVLAVTLVLGVTAAGRAIAAVVGGRPSAEVLIGLAVGAAAALAIPLARAAARGRRALG